MDDETRRLCRSHWAAESTSRHSRSAELLQRMLTRAEAARWPPHSLAVAWLRMCAAKSLRSVCNREHRQNDGPSTTAPHPSAEELRLWRGAAAVVLARLEARTLLRCTPSENAFQVAWYAEEPATRQPDLLQLPPHSLGLRLAAATAEGLMECAVCSWCAERERYHGGITRDMIRALAASTATVSRLVEFVATARSDPACEPSLVSRFRCVEEGILKDALDDYLSNTGLPLGAAGASGFIVMVHGEERLQEAHRSLCTVVDASVMNELTAKSASVSRAYDARAARESWTPRLCAHCSKAEPEPRLWKLCSRCAGPAYCCKEHQVAHWKAGHKAECRARTEPQGGASASAPSRA